MLTATTYLVLLIALLVSCFSLPNDFRSKTIYTVVTKPVRAGDIVLGRILGFTIVGTVLLAIMAVCSAGFVWRMLEHTHTVKIDSLENIYDAKGKVVGKKGRTTTNQQHSHEVEILPDGSGIAMSTNEHEHESQHRTAGGETSLSRQRPARACCAPAFPNTASSGFSDRKGVEVAKGISVGSEWTYRSFIEGGTPMAAIWTFSGINESSLRKDDSGAEVLPMELIVRVFRTFKGDIENGIQGIVQLRNPDPKADGKYVKSEPWTFTRQRRLDQHVRLVAQAATTPIRSRSTC